MPFYPREALLHEYGLYINNNREWLERVRALYKSPQKERFWPLKALLFEVRAYATTFGPQPTKVAVAKWCLGDDYSGQPIFDHCYCEEEA